MFSAKVLSALSYKGETVVVQRLKKHGGWTRLKNVRLNKQSAKKFSVKVPKGTTTIRALMKASQVGPGYARATSNPVRIKRK